MYFCASTYPFSTSPRGLPFRGSHTFSFERSVGICFDQSTASSVSGLPCTAGSETTGLPCVFGFGSGIVNFLLGLLGGSFLDHRQDGQVYVPLPLFERRTVRVRGIETRTVPVGFTEVIQHRLSEAGTEYLSVNLAQLNVRKFFCHYAPMPCAALIIGAAWPAAFAISKVCCI